MIGRKWASIYVPINVIQTINKEETLDNILV